MIEFSCPHTNYFMLFMSSTYAPFFLLYNITHTVFLPAVPALSVSVKFVALIVFCHPRGKGQQFHFKATVAQNRRQSKEVVFKYPAKIFPPKES